MSDAGHTAGTAAPPTTGAPLVQRIRLIVVAVFVLGIFVQVYLAGRGVFGASSFSAHRTFGNIIGGFPPVGSGKLDAVGRVLPNPSLLDGVVEDHLEDAECVPNGARLQP